MYLLHSIIGNAIDYLRMAIPAMEWPIWPVIIGDAFTSII